LQIKIEDETKFPMASLRKDPTLLASIFATMLDEDNDTIGFDDSLEYADAFLDWEDADDAHRLNGAEASDYYEDLDPPYFAANREIQSFDEFRLIKGFGPDPDDPDEHGLFFDAKGNETQNFRDFKQSISLHSTHKLNINGASSFILRFLCGENDSGREELEEFFQEGKNSDGSQGQQTYFQDLNDPKLLALDEQKKKQWVDSAFQVGRIKITATRGKATFMLHALVEVPSGSSNPSNPTAPKPATPAASSIESAASKRFEELNYPIRILALRENENFID
ncbi:MAG: hypothetical protein VB980_04470, partial [Opitutales bacterium]